MAYIYVVLVYFDFDKVLYSYMSNSHTNGDS